MGGRARNRDGGLQSLVDDQLHYSRNGSGFEELFAYRTDSLERDNVAEAAACVTTWLASDAGSIPPSPGTAHVAQGPEDPSMRKRLGATTPVVHPNNALAGAAVPGTKKVAAAARASRVESLKS